MENALSREEVARTFGGQELAGGATVHGQVYTSLSFAPGPEPRGRVGMHHARWEVDYETAGQTLTAAVDLECGAALVRPRWPVVDARTGLPALYVPIRMADSMWLSDAAGEAGAHLPAGAHRYEVLGPRWAPTSGVADTRSPRDRPIRARRLAPEIEPGSFTTACNADGSVCTAGVTAYDPSGAVSLPDSVPGSVRSVAVDANRRRYEFRTSRSPWGVALFEVRLTSATGLQARYQCGTEHPTRPTGCGEFAPPGFPFQSPGAPR